MPRIDEVRLSGADARRGWRCWPPAAALVLGDRAGDARRAAARRPGAPLRRALVAPTVRRRGALRRALVAAEFALATPLLVAAVLVLASLDRLEPRAASASTRTRVLTASVSLPRAALCRSRPTARRSGSAPSSGWRRCPASRRVALADSRPPRRAARPNNFDLEDRPTPAGQNQPVCPWVGVVARLLQGGRAAARAGPPARRTLAPGRRRRRRSRLGGAVLSRRGGARPPIHERRLHHLPVDDRRRRGRRREVGGPRRRRGRRHGLLPVRRSCRAGIFVVRDRRRSVGRARGRCARRCSELDPGLALSDVATGDDLWPSRWRRRAI